MNAQDQATYDLLSLCTDILNALRSYAEKHNAEIEDTTAEVLENEGERPKVIVTVPKYIDEDHREKMEQLALEAAAHNPLNPLRRGSIFCPLHLISPRQHSPLSKRGERSRFHGDNRITQPRH